MSHGLEVSRSNGGSGSRSSAGWPQIGPIVVEYFGLVGKVVFV